MAVPYTVKLEGGGEMRVNANSQAAAEANVRSTGNTPAASQGGGGGGGNPGGGGGGGGQDLGALRDFFSQTAGFSREELAEKKRQFDEQMALAEREWQRQGLPELAIKQKLADLEVEKFRSTTGLDLLKFSSTLGGPADYFQSVDFNRGASQRGDVPLFLQSLLSSTGMSAFTGPGNVAPTPQTAAGLAAKLTGGANSYTNPDQALAQISSIFQGGATGLAPGSLERLDQNELDLLRSGGKKLGYDPEAWIRSYARAGIGQSAGVV